MFNLFKRKKKQQKKRYDSDATGDHVSYTHSTAINDTSTDCSTTHTNDSSSNADGGSCGGGDQIIVDFLDFCKYTYFSFAVILKQQYKSNMDIFSFKLNHYFYGGDSMLYETGEIVCSNCRSLIKWKKTQHNVDDGQTHLDEQSTKLVHITDSDDEIRCPQCLVYVPLTSKI